MTEITQFLTETALGFENAALLAEVRRAQDTPYIDRNDHPLTPSEGRH